VKRKMEIVDEFRKISLKNFSFFTIVGILMIIAGLLFWIYWGTRYGVWNDIGIYSFVSVFIIAGILATIISLLEKEEEED
jgi:hypothetical protein